MHSVSHVSCSYAAYNKVSKSQNAAPAPLGLPRQHPERYRPPDAQPEAVIDWLDHNVPKHDYVLVLDSDMVLRRPFFIE
jgi:hypothetical protein